MELFPWNNEYSLKIESIDKDHKHLLDLINKLFDAMSKGKAKEVLNEIMNSLIDYTKTHFQREEFYFRSTNYPDFEAHKLQHELFVKKVNELKNLFEKGDSKVSTDLIRFLSEWLINHIKVSDKAYASHLIKYHVK